MNRSAIFEAIRAARSDKRFNPDEVREIDALLDDLGVPRMDGQDDWLPLATALVKRFEGCKLTAYPDPATGGDPWTIAYGATGEGIHKGVTWTQAQADERLAHDLARFAAGVDKLVSEKTTGPQKAALVDFAYNVGLANLKTSTLLRMHNDGDVDGATAQFLRWNRADGKPMQGLTNRRLAEGRVYRGLPL